jgi:DNA (cytosine-5)-methyltransferase 1
MKKLKAIDLYSGIGGWALGLKLNKIEVINSYEWWQQAVDTSNKNLGQAEEAINVREMDFSKLRNKGIDVVVGSPPCTQFSYSNRGGSGDIKDGIIDLYKFFECVHVLKPKFWAMENVPRVANVLINEILPGGQLYKFRKIINSGFVEVFNMREFGIPQKRKRCIASNIDLDLMMEYKDRCKEVTLENVIDSLSKDSVMDPNFKIRRTLNNITEMEKEEPLNSEEERMNREMKVNHPVYNKMSFPEDLSNPARTITATCTRVSRESLIVKSKRKYRRLSVRERGTIQGFPISYQFHGSSHSNKIKMIGNAIPPKFTYFLAAAMRGTSGSKLKLPKEVAVKIEKSSPKVTSPDTQSKSYPATRSFKFAMPSLNFKSGTRFEINNSEEKFKCFFYYGDSKRIRSIKLDKILLNKALKFINDIDENLKFRVHKTLKKVKACNHSDIQKAWSIKPSVGTHPFEIVDNLDELSNLIVDLLSDIEDDILVESMKSIFQKNDDVGLKKVSENYRRIFSGLIVCSHFNYLK